MTAPVVITGGLGYLGGRLARALLDAGIPVRLTTRQKASALPAWAKGATLVPLDLADEAGRTAALHTALSGARACVHLAGPNAAQCAADPALAERVVVGGTAAVVDAARTEDVRRIVYLSTAHVYDAPLQGSIHEAMPTRPAHPYAETRRRAEDIVRQGCVEPVVARLSNAFGAPMDAHADCWMLMANDFVRTAVAEGEIRISGTGSDVRDFIPMTDAVAAISHLLALSDAARTDGVFNIGSGQSRSVLTFAKHVQARMRAVTGRDIPLRMAKSGDAVPEQGLRYDVSKLAASGFVAALDFDLEIDNLIHFCEVSFSKTGSIS